MLMANISMTPELSTHALLLAAPYVQVCLQLLDLGKRTMQLLLLLLDRRKGSVMTGLRGSW